jgi:hypothetical protein
MMKINCPATPFATAFGMPINDAINRVLASARELDAAAEKTSREQGGFGSRLTQAVRRKQSPCVFAAAPRKNDDNDDDDIDKAESFGNRIKNAVQRKTHGTKRKSN